MEVTEKAPAKINLLLNILGKRDDGFHEMELVMTPIDLSDRVTVADRNDGQIRVSSDSSFMPHNENNITYKAAAALRKYAKINRGIDISIMKNIPIAAGLGGGSADAAAVLRGLNKLWDLNLSLDELDSLGRSIGSDVPFCLYNQTSFAYGRGEQIQFIGEMPACWVIVVKPPKGISSWTVFQNLSIDKLHNYNSEELIHTINKNNYKEMTAWCGNALEEVSAEQRPMIKRVKDKMLRFGLDTALMSGTGPTVIGLTQKKAIADRVVNSLRGFCEEVYLVRTL